MNFSFKEHKNLIFVVFFSTLLLLSIVLNVVFVFTKPVVKYKIDNNILFFGDSLTARYDLDFYFPKKNVINKGVGGEKTEDLLERIDKDVYEYNPSKIFVQCGINDIINDIDKEDILLNIRTIITGIKVNRSYAKVYMESLYPVNEKKVKDSDNEKHRKLNNKQIKEYNEEIKKICEDNSIIYINVFDEMTDKDGNLKELYTNDGLHLTNLGYLKLTSILKDYIEK